MMSRTNPLRILIKFSPRILTIICSYCCSLYVILFSIKNKIALHQRLVIRSLLSVHLIIASKNLNYILYNRLHTHTAIIYVCALYIMCMNFTCSFCQPNSIFFSCTEIRCKLSRKLRVFVVEFRIFFHSYVPEGSYYFVIQIHKGNKFVFIWSFLSNSSDVGILIRDFL